ncbi:hypothetical protein [Falsiroseomonas sp. E2-1-a20]
MIGLWGMLSDRRRTAVMAYARMIAKEPGAPHAHQEQAPNIAP